MGTPWPLIKKAKCVVSKLRTHGETSSRRHGRKSTTGDFNGGIEHQFLPRVCPRRRNLFCTKREQGLGHPVSPAVEQSVVSSRPASYFSLKATRLFGRLPNVASRLRREGKSSAISKATFILIHIEVGAIGKLRIETPPPPPPPPRPPRDFDAAF